VLSDGAELIIATSCPSFVRGYFSRQGIPTQIICRTGSVEIALGVVQGIVDIVIYPWPPMGIEVIREIEPTAIYLIDDLAYYKLLVRVVDLQMSWLASR